MRVRAARQVPRGKVRGESKVAVSASLVLEGMRCRRGRSEPPISRDSPYLESSLGADY